jgi:hypothetical protein
METFSLQWKNVFSVEPRLGPTTVGLPENQGMVLLKLLAQTKLQQAVTADVVLACSAASGFSVGKWLERLCLESQDEGVLPMDHILACDNGRPWTSHCCRHTFPCPLWRPRRHLAMHVCKTLMARRVTASLNASGLFIVTVAGLGPMFLDLASPM